VKRKRSRLALFGVLALALSVTVGITAGSVEAKKKKVKTFSETVKPNLAIPDDPGAPADTGPIVTSEIKVPKKKYKKSLVGDVNVTGLTTTGSALDAADDLYAFLSAPNNRTILLFTEVGDQNLGPWTMDDDTRQSICDDDVPPCGEPYAFATLFQPFAGTANLLLNNDDVGGAPGGPLSNFDGLKMKGTWTLSIYDQTAGGAQTSTLNSWGLQIKPQKPPAVVE
jgi:hypothetical protein